MMPDPETDTEDARSAQLQAAEDAIRHGDFSKAERLALQVLETDSTDLQALYLIAVSRRYAGQNAQALNTLNNLLEAHSGYGRAFQEIGHNQLVLKSETEAMQAFEHAVRFNPSLIASWRILHQLYRKSGNEAGAITADAELRYLAGLPKELIAITSLYHESKLYKAEQLCRAYLREHPKDVEAMRLLALIAIRLSVYDDAEFLLESCVEFEPVNWRARADYVTVLHKRQKFEAAYKQAELLKDSFPGNVAFEMTFANQAVALGQFEMALDIYDRIVETHPRLDMPHLVRGHALKTIGRLEEGIASYRAAYKARPDFGDAFWSLANLKTYKFGPQEIEQMKAGFSSPNTALNDRFHLAFALGKAHEDIKDFDNAFDYYAAGNALKKQDVRYDPQQVTGLISRQKQLFTPDYFAERSGFGAPDADPIFIIGLPRAGSTLLEQILASHSQVDGTMELPNIIALFHKLNGRRMVSEDPRYPGVLETLTAEQCDAFGSDYIADTRVHRQGAPFFIDKMPNNFLHIGLIQLILPNAKIIDARREPMSCCFSGFKQLFADGQEFTYSLEDIGAYYHGYVELMNHWDAILPGRVLRVQHEDVVGDLENEVRRMLDFCGLPFEAACLEFHKTERSVRTPSSEQVRQPIYSSGLEQWRAFEAHLDPLKSALGDALTNYR